MCVSFSKPLWTPHFPEFSPKICGLCQLLSIAPEAAAKTLASKCFGQMPHSLPVSFELGQFQNRANKDKHFELVFQGATR